MLHSVLRRYVTGLLRTAVLLFVCLSLLSAPPTLAQDCAAPSIIQTNQELQSFAGSLSSAGCQFISGDLQIGSCDSPSLCEITLLSPVDAIPEIRGSLSIECCASLTELSGFQSLRTVWGPVSVYFNRNLAAISGFASLRNVTSVRISQNPQLRTVSGFTSLSLIRGYLEIDRNTDLLDLSGFRSLQTIQGTEVILGHALTLTYNTNLTSLSSFVGLSEILYGTVHIEGNARLCYAGYPQWNVGSYPVRTEVVGGVDVGIDWRTKLASSVPNWQYTWNVVGGGYPTLFIRDNAPSQNCGEASCNSSCPPGAGCLGPGSLSLCGTCRRLDDNSNTCDAVPAPPTGGANTTAIALGIVIPILIIILLVVLALGIWGGVVLFKKWKDGRKGSFDIAYSSGAGSMEGGGVKFISSSSQQRQASQQIAEPTSIGSNVTRTSLRRQPMDNVVMSSYKPHSSSPTRPRPRATPTRSAPSPSSRQQSLPRSSHSPPPPPPPTSSHSEHPMTAKRAPFSRSPSEGRRAPVRAAAIATSSGTAVEEEKRQTSTEEMTDDSRNEEAEIPMDFPREQIKLGKEIGVGDFGKVIQADAKKLLPGQKKTTVVVKQLKEGATKEDRDAFLRPVEAMKILRHPNVLSLLGVSMSGPSLLVLLEYCAQGNFKTFLIRKRREAAAMKESKQLLKMACDMASGLNYLHNKSIAHNDFAVRSCLVTDDVIVKLGDYGITRQTFKEDYYSRGKNQKAWPIRWMAPEQIVVQGRNILDSLPVSLQANIWSFGIAMWEVCSFAEWPYEEMSNEEVIQTVKTTGKCLLENPLQPNDPLAKLFDICLLCWQPFELRPLMNELLTTLKDMLVGGKVRWPNQRGSVGVALPGESSRTSSSGLRPKRPAPTKPPANKGLPRQHKEREQGLVISNMAARSQEEVETERDLVPKATALSQDAGSRAIMKSTKREETVSKSHKSILHREELGSSKEPLLEGSRSLSAEESGVPEVVPLQVVPPPPPPQAQEEVDSGSAATAEQKKKRRRKSAEIKYEGEAKHRSKSKHKKKSEHKKEAVKGSEETQGRNQTTFKMTEPSVEEGELPLPQEIAEAAADEALMIGAAGVGEGEEEFILDPPSKFSQSSVDYLDDFGDIDESGALSIDFAPPTAPSDDELEDELHPPPPPISHSKKTPPHNNPPTSKTVSSEVKKKRGNFKPGKTVAAASKKRGGAPTEFPSSSMKEEWKGLDYPVRHSPWSRSSQEETGHANLAFPLDNRENQFTHRDALEEEEDDESRVVLDEDVAVLLW